jgi:hypothetical protein
MTPSNVRSMLKDSLPTLDKPLFILSRDGKLSLPPQENILMRWEVDPVQIRKLSPKERQYLIENQGCFRCLAINVDQTHLKNCPKFQRPAHPGTNNPPTKQTQRLDEIDQQETMSEEEEDRYISADAAIPRQAEFNSICFAINDIVVPPSSSPHSTHKIPTPNFRHRDIGDWMLNREVAADLFTAWGTPTNDLFATSKNKQAEFNYRKPSDNYTDNPSGCLGQNPLAQTWNFQELVYANPPCKLLEATIAKIEQDATRRVTFISPFENDKLEQLSVEPYRVLTHTSDLFIPPHLQDSGIKGVSRDGRKVMHSSSTVARDTSSRLGKQKPSLLSLRTIRGSSSDALSGEIRHPCWQIRGAPPTLYLPTS